MPRGKRKTCVEKLEELRGLIEDLEAQLRELKTKEKELLKEKKEEELRQIAELLEDRNLTTDQLTEILNQVGAKECTACDAGNGEDCGEIGA